jgi:hypothetical protein
MQQQRSALLSACMTRIRGQLRSACIPDPIRSWWAARPTAGGARACCNIRHLAASTATTARAQSCCGDGQQRWPPISHGAPTILLASPTQYHRPHAGVQGAQGASSRQCDKNLASGRTRPATRRRMSVPSFNRYYSRSLRHTPACSRARWYRLASAPVVVPRGAPLHAGASVGRRRRSIRW